MKKIFALILFIAPFIAGAQVSGLELPYGIKVMDTLATDAWYGPYPDVETALESVEVGARKNRTVKIDTIEYWWRDGSADEDLVVKTSSSGGADITVVMDSIANAIDTLITNSAGENEIMVSDGTNAIPSGMKVTYDSSSLTRTIGNMGASYQLRLSPGGPVLIGPPEGSGGTEYKFFTNSFTAEGLFSITNSAFQWGFGTGTPTLDLTTNQVTIGNPLLQSSIIMYPNGHPTWPGLFLISAGLTLDIGAGNLIFSKQKTTEGKHLLTIDNVGKVETKAMDTLVSVTQMMDSITNAIDTLSAGGSTNATAIRGVTVDASASSPSDGDILVYRNDDSAWVLESKPTGDGIEIAQVMDSISNAIDTLVSVSQMMDSIQNDWGDIGGTLSAQTDLQNELDGKQTITPTAATGTSVAFDTNRSYCTSASPCTGNITFNSSGAIVGQMATMIHNSGSEPTFGSEFIILSGEYVTSEDNYIMFFLRESGKVWVTISQEQ